MEIKMSSDLSVIEKNGKFVVARNNQPIVLPKTDGEIIVTEFSNKADAEKYMSILKYLEKKQSAKSRN
jgi:hypothetical protein